MHYWVVFDLFSCTLLAIIEFCDYVLLKKFSEVKTLSNIKGYGINFNKL